MKNYFLQFFVLVELQDFVLVEPQDFVLDDPQDFDEQFLLVADFVLADLVLEFFSLVEPALVALVLALF